MKDQTQKERKLVENARKSTARNILLLVVMMLLALPVACALSVHGQELEVVVETSNLLTGADFSPIVGGESVSSEPDFWTVETSWSSRSAFKAFGSVASDDPIVGMSLTYADNEWDIFILVVEPVGTHEAGVIADFVDPIIQRKFSLGEWSGKVGTEIFYGPSYRGGEALTAIAPLASLVRNFSGGWSCEVGGQYVATYHSKYSGDRLYVYGEMSYMYKKGSWVLGVSGGIIASDKSRYSAYVKPKVSYQTSWVKFQASLLRSESDSRTGRFAIPATPTLSAIWTF